MTRNIADLYRLTYLYGIHGPDQENIPWTALPNAAGRANTGLVFDSNGLPSVGFIPTTIFTQATWDFFLNASAGLAIPVGKALYPPTVDELNSGVVIVNGWYPYGNVLRYGLVPNSVSAASSNTAICRALWNLTSGVVGNFTFPNTTGADVYSTQQVRDMIQKYGAVERVRERAQQFTDKARQLIGEFPESPFQSALAAVTGKHCS